MTKQGKRIKINKKIKSVLIRNFVINYELSFNNNCHYFLLLITKALSIKEKFVLALYQRNAIEDILRKIVYNLSGNFFI